MGEGLVVVVVGVGSIPPSVGFGCDSFSLSRFLLCFFSLDFVGEDFDFLGDLDTGNVCIEDM